jgi:hypothetical protein
MAAPPLPPHLEDLGKRPFSFYPPIVGVDHNEWMFDRGNWSEILVRNTQSGTEVWIPRSYLGEVSKVDHPVMIVGLKRELEYKGGAVWPYMRRVLSMPPNPIAAPPAPGAEPPPELSTAARLGLDNSAESRIGKLIVAALAIGVFLTVAVIGVLKIRSTGGRIEYKGVLQADLGFTSQTDYFDVVRKLGPPAEDRWREEQGERQYRVLVYPKQDLIVVLMGADRDKSFYIGAKNRQWRTVHSVPLPGGLNTEAILRTLKPF